MTGIFSGPSISNSGAQIRLALLLTAAVLHCAACISNQVRVEASDGDVLARAATLHVSLARADDPDAPAEAAVEARAAAIGSPINPALEAALRASAEDALRAKGYAVGSAAESDLILELAPRNESVSQRSWSSDPDASGTRIVQKSEAVLTLRARSRGDSAEVWRAEARARLPESGLVLGTSAEKVWNEVLAKALERVPARR